MIKDLIRSAETSGEFRRLVHGRAKVVLGSLQTKGVAFRHGGTDPDPPLDQYPLLAWRHTGHPKHGLSVFTEDQKASVNEIAKAFLVVLSPEALAAEFGTTIGHVTEVSNTHEKLVCSRSTSTRVLPRAQFARKRLDEHDRQPHTRHSSQEPTSPVGNKRCQKK